MNESKAARKFRLFARLSEMGFTFDEATSLYKIQLTLNRWSVAECNGEIQRDETTEKPFRVLNWHAGEARRYDIADREAGAIRRLDAIMAAHPTLWRYHQGDPRGCSLWVGRKADLPKMERAEIERMEGANAAKTPASRLRAVIRSHYTRGVAVCI